jgi:hypothetical protein
MDNILLQIIIALVVVILMGYIAYNIYTVEFDKLLKGNTLKKTTTVFNGIMDFNTNTDIKYDTFDITSDKYIDISPSINQQGGAEYSYNFWLYVDKNELKKNNKENLDYVLLLKGNKDIFVNNNNHLNCSSDRKLLMIKNPLIRLKPEGDGIAIEYNNIMTIDSYQDVNIYKDCSSVESSWKKKNANLLGVYDLEFDKKWFMITVVMKEVSSPTNILFNSKASSKIYINGILVSDKTVETKYDNKTYSATFKNNNSPLYINPQTKYKDVDSEKNAYAEKPSKSDTIKMADLKYYNYALEEEEISKTYNLRFIKTAFTPILNERTLNISNKNPMDSSIKEL